FKNKKIIQMKILANDGISKSGVEALEKAGFEVILTHVAQNQLADYINKNNIDVVLVRSATKIRKDLIDTCPGLQMIGRGGVGMDNIDVEYAREKGIKVINTPAASSASVAELVFAHLFGAVRSLHFANREMPLEGESRFKDLKKSYSKGVELRGKTLGVIGLGKIGQEVAKIALGIGMKVIGSGRNTETVSVELKFYDGNTIDFNIQKIPLDEVLTQSDFISLHLPAQEKYIIGKKEIEKMKEGA